MAKLSSGRWTRLLLMCFGAIACTHMSGCLLLAAGAAGAGAGYVAGNEAADDDDADHDDDD